jgi:hypothetical protein
MNYPLRIRFWYFVHDKSEALWHWVWRTRLQPWHFSLEQALPEPKYVLVAEHDASEEDRARGIVKRRIYKGPASGPPPPVEGTYSYHLSFDQPRDKSLRP